VASRTVHNAALPSGLTIVEPPVDIPPFDFVSIWRADAESDPESAWLRSRIRAAIKR
jgi:hypothetical protein